jgi:predicted membrane-bound mannosyltransferase
MNLSKRKVQRVAAMAHQALALGSLLALMILIPTRDPQGGLGSRFREPNRVPVKVQAMVPAAFHLAVSDGAVHRTAHSIAR